MKPLKPHEQIPKLLRASILQVAKNRLIHKFYKDDKESRQRFYFPTLEGLEAILIPAIALKEARWPTLLSDFPELRTIVSEDIEHVLPLNTNTKKKEQGAPYFATGRRGSTKYFWISECGAFTLSTLINILTLSKLFPTAAPSFDNASLRKVIKQSVSDLLACSVPQGGWSWSKGGKTADAWATWSVVETFTDYLEYNEEFDIKFPEISKVRSSLARTAEYLAAQLTWQSPDTIAGMWYEKVYETQRMKTRKEVKCAYSFVHTIISSSLLGLQNDKQFRELAALLFNSVERVKVKDVENLAKVASQDENIDDYSYNPTLLRALTSIYVEMDAEGRKDLRQKLDSSPISYIKKQFNTLMSDYIVTGEWAGLWGYHKNYEIYYTERTIEALVSLSKFLMSWEPRVSSWQIPQLKKVTIDELQAALEKALTGVKL